VRASDSSSNSSGRYEEEEDEDATPPQRQLFAEAEKRRKEKKQSSSGLTESEREALRSEWRAEFKKIGAERLAACYRVEYRKDEDDGSTGSLSIPEEEEKKKEENLRKIAGEDDWDG